MPMGKMIRDEQNASFTKMTNDSVYRLLDSLSVQHASLRFIRRVGSTHKLQQSPIFVVRNCMYNCCHEIGIKPSMYTYILYEWCVFNWYPDVTLMWSIVTTYMYIKK